MDFITKNDYYQIMPVKKRHPIFLATLVLLLLAGSGLAGFYIGTFYPKKIVIKGVDNIENGVILNADFGIVWETWQVVKDAYLRAADVSNQALIHGAASGLVQSLKDPHSIFLPPADSKKFAEDLNGSFGGIGAEIGIKNETLTVIAPLKNSPAEKAGIRSGDKILEINATSTVNLSINEAVKLIRGPKGTEVKFTIGRSGSEKPLKITVVRDTINVPITEWKMKENQLAHLQLFTFSENSPQLMKKAIEEIKAAGAKGIVLDLRNDPGGFLESAIQIASFFVKPGDNIVFEEFRSGKKNVFNSTGDQVAKDIPLVILINSGSASASEIVAGALRDNLGTKIIGEKSFGKGTVQELKNLHDGSTVKITIAHWVLPGGLQIDKNGIEPDIAIKPTDEDIEKKNDVQLAKALEILREQVK